MTAVFIHLPQEERFGPFRCPKDVDVLEYARRLLESAPPNDDSPQRLADHDIWIDLPKIANEAYVLLLVSTEGKKKHTTHVYVVEMKRGTISLDEVRSFVHCSPSSFDKDSLRPYEDQKDENPPKKGTVHLIPFSNLIIGFTTLLDVERCSSHVYAHTHYGPTYVHTHIHAYQNYGTCVHGHYVKQHVQNMPKGVHSKPLIPTIGRHHRFRYPRINVSWSHLKKVLLPWVHHLPPPERDH